MGNSVSQSQGLGLEFHGRAILNGLESGSRRCGWYNASNLKQLYRRLSAGDLVEMDRGMYKHWAVCVEVNDRWAMVIHLNQDTGITEVDLEEVLGEGECRINNAYDDTLTFNSGSETVRRARYFLKFPDEFGPYHMVSNNCEHLVNMCRYNEKRSGQVVEAVVGGVVGTVVAAKLAYDLFNRMTEKEEDQPPAAIKYKGKSGSGGYTHY